MELNLILNSQLSTDWYLFQTFHTLQRSLQGGLFQLLETVVIFFFLLGSRVYILAFTLNILIYQLNDKKGLLLFCLQN